MQLHLSLSRKTAVEPSLRVLRVAGMFGLGVEEDRKLTLIPPITLDLTPRQLIFITGPSGSGKSSLLALIDEAARGRDDACVIRFDRLPPLPDRPLVDCLDAWLPIDLDESARLSRVLAHLSRAGLGDAFVMLRKPGELSDGQRYRLRLAQVMAMIESHGTCPGARARSDSLASPEALTIVLADEFGATLDRLTAAVIARNVRKWTRTCATPVCFIAATTHDDLLEPLEPDVLVEKHLGERMEMATSRKSGGAAKEVVRLAVGSLGPPFPRRGTAEGGGEDRSLHDRR